jgi:glycolate oxidase
MIPSAALTSLANIVGPEYLRLDRESLKKVASDGTKLQFFPDAVIYPGDSDDISEILKLANRDGFYVIPRGAGTGMTGGALPVKGGLVMAMERLNRILLLDRPNLLAKVEPGVITGDLQREAEKLGLFYPPDPASADTSTIGGNVAECAGGLRAVKYGVTRDYVLGLTAVLPTGEIIRTGVETPKGVAGYDLTRLLVGSEGTLSVITSVTLRLLPKPVKKRTMLAFFSELSSAAETVSGILGQGIIPTTLEFMDRLSIDCVRDEIELPLSSGIEALLLIEVDGDGYTTSRDADKIQAICRTSGAIFFQQARDQKESERLWKARKELSPSMMKLRPDKISEDVVVPRSRLAEFISFLRALGESSGLPIPAFGHAGDGNIHVNFMLDKSDKEEVKKVHLAVKSLFEKVTSMGGTITGEHGIGITKAPFLGIEISTPALELMARIKKAFDPQGILNPGKIFPFDPFHTHDQSTGKEQS